MLYQASDGAGPNGPIFPTHAPSSSSSPTPEGQILYTPVPVGLLDKSCTCSSLGRARCSTVADLAVFVSLVSFTLKQTISRSNDREFVHDLVYLF
jgi:hypothetical protein